MMVGVLCGVLCTTPALWSCAHPGEASALRFAGGCFFSSFFPFSLDFFSMAFPGVPLCHGIGFLIVAERPIQWLS